MYLGMPKAWDIAAYTFQADTWCPDCMREFAVGWVMQGRGVSNWWSPERTTEEVLKRWADEIGVNPDDESSYDSGDFPKVVFHSQVEDVEHCGQCNEEI